MMAVRVVIDGDGRESAVIVDWPDWRMLANVARGAMPMLFDDVSVEDVRGDETSACSGDGLAGGGGDARSAGDGADGWREVKGGRVVDPAGARRVQ